MVCVSSSCINVARRIEHNDEYQKMVRRVFPPRVVVDNISCQRFSLLKVDSANKHGLLLEVVQILTDLELNIHKAYISSDGGWFMDVFHVTDASGEKVMDDEMIRFIQKRIVDGVNEQFPQSVGVQTAREQTTIELTGTDRPGLMSEVFALLTHLKCNIVAAELWTHNMRVACLVCVTEQATSGPVCEPERLAQIKESLGRLLKADSDARSSPAAAARTDVGGAALTHTERRLHQLMFADRDYEGPCCRTACDLADARVSVHSCDDRGYSVVNVECRNRPKLLFDTVCTLTDMDYAIFHAIVDTDGEKAYQEYYIRHIDGCTLDSEAERRRVIQCLKAAIERRVSEGLRLELCTSDRVGLLSDVTRIFREHGLSVARADVSTKGSTATNVFYVTDAAGNQVDPRAVEAVRREIGQAVLRIRPPQPAAGSPAGGGPAPCKSPSLVRTNSSRFSLSSLLGNLGLLRS